MKTLNINSIITKYTKVLFNKIETIALVILIPLTFTHLALNSYISSIDINTYHIDGAYQTYSYMILISQGKLVGRDFMPYLGIGVIYSLYPIFLLMGSNIFASIFASYFATGIAYIASYFLLCRITILSKLSMKMSLLASMLLYYLLFFLNKPVFFKKVIPDIRLEDLIYPGHSLLPIRSFLPFLISAFIIFHAKKVIHPFIIGALCAFSLLWSNDYGYTGALLLMLLYVLLEPRPVKITAQRVFLASLSTAVIYFTCLSIITGGHAFPYLDMNFNGFGKSQFWYYWPYRDRYYSLPDVLLFWQNRRYSILLCILVALVVVFVQAIKEKSRNLYLLSFLGFTTLASGLLTEVAGHVYLRYYKPLVHLSPFLFLQAASFLLVQLERLNIYNSINNALFIQRIRNFRSHLFIPFLVMAIIPVTIVFSSLLDRIDRTMDKVKTSDVYIKEFGGYWDKDKLDNITYAQANNEYSLVGEYYTAFSAFMNKPVNTKATMLIHALGDDLRNDFISALNREDVIALTTNPVFSEWQEWSLFQNWDYYKQLLLNFHPDAHLNNVIIWKKQNDPLLINNNPLSCETFKTSMNKVYIIIRSPIHFDNNALFDLTINYELDFKPGLTPVAGKNRVIIVSDAYSRKEFSFSPFRSMGSIPVIMNGYTHIVSLESEPEERTTLEVNGCKLQQIGHADKSFYSISLLKDIHYLKSLPKDRNYTEILKDLLEQGKLQPVAGLGDKWINGVSLQDSRVRFTNIPGLKDRIEASRYVKLNRSSNRKVKDRKIKEVISDNDYVYIEFEGPPLSPVHDGFPFLMKLL
ncbi:hypothetical protein ACFL4R_00155 [Nitrospirota bacterium]